MGQTTPNMSIYIPAAGETNYDNSFLLGMINIDQHDHSGPPDNGVPIASSGIADDSITYNKLNANVADNATGIGTETGPNANKLTMLGILKSLFQITPTNGYIAANGNVAVARTLTGTAHQIAVSNGNGTTADPVFSLSPIVTNTTQPAFSYTAVSQPDVTGDGTAYIVQFATQDFDQGSNFTGGTTFTVPVGGAGIYMFNVDISFGDLGAANTLAFVDIYVNGVFVDRGFNCNLGAIRNAGSGAQLPFAQILKLADTNAVTIVATVSNGTKIVDVLPGSNFTGCKLC